MAILEQRNQTKPSLSKTPAQYIQYLNNYHRQQPPQVSTVKLTPRLDQQARLAKIAEDGFRAIDEAYCRNHRSCQQAACIQCNKTITSDRAAKIYGGFMVNEYGRPINQ